MRRIYFLHNTIAHTERKPDSQNYHYCSKFQPFNYWYFKFHSQQWTFNTKEHSTMKYVKVNQWISFFIQSHMFLIFLIICFNTKTKTYPMFIPCSIEKSSTSTHGTVPVHPSGQYIWSLKMWQITIKSCKIKWNKIAHVKSLFFYPICDHTDDQSGQVWISSSIQVHMQLINTLCIMISN